MGDYSLYAEIFFWKFTNRKSSWTFTNPNATVAAKTQANVVCLQQQFSVRQVTVNTWSIGVDRSNQWNLSDRGLGAAGGVQTESIGDEMAEGLRCVEFLETAGNASPLPSADGTKSVDYERDAGGGGGHLRSTRK